MSTTEIGSDEAPAMPDARTVDMKLEVVVLPVSDTGRAKRFYEGLGWRLDSDFRSGDTFRGLQFTPRGSGCSIPREWDAEHLVREQSGDELPA